MYYIILELIVNVSILIDTRLILRALQIYMYSNQTNLGQNPNGNFLMTLNLKRLYNEQCQFRYPRKRL